MVYSLSLFRTGLAFALGATVCAGQSLLPADPIPLESLAAFQPTAANWQIAGDLAGDPRLERTLTPSPGTGVLVNTPREGANAHLLTAWEHGDLELELEFLLPVRANSGIYFQGRYELQLADSWAVREPTFSDCGGIYQRWDEARGAGQQGYDGIAPRANACRAPGLWQHLRVSFEAPRFDGDGKKTKNARFAKVVLNGFTIHENVELTGPTRTPLVEDERPLGPLLIQGNHGPVAFRRFAVKRFGGERVAVEDVRYKLYSGEFRRLGDYETLRPTAEGVPTQFAQGAVEKTGRYALVFTGTLVVPKDGAYAFSIESNSVTRLTIDERTVAVPLERNSAPGTIALSAGRHAFRLDMLHQQSGRAGLELVVEGPGLPPHTLTVRDPTFGPPRSVRQLLVTPKDRPLVQRSFVPFEPRKKLYAVNVGTPSGVHFSYDTETGAVLRMWRGKFLDAFEMWDGRGHNQTGNPAGPALTLNAKPAFALVEYPQTGDWPDAPEALWTARGYRLTPEGLPIFLARLAGIEIRDGFAPAENGRGWVRTIETAGKLPEWSAWILLAEAATIARQPRDRGWIVGDREWYLDWPADATVQPVLRGPPGRRQLAIPLTRETLEQTLTYALVW